MSKYEMEQGFWWPVSDRACRAVIFGWQGDIEISLEPVKQFRTVIQAGGNCGLWPVELSKRFDRVYTFEPDADNFHCLSQNIKLHKRDNITAQNAALGASAGSVGLHLTEGNCGAHWVVPEGNIPRITIDSLGLDDVDLIMLDIEGYELNALRGAVKTIERCKPVIVVEDKGLSNKFGSRQGDIEDWLGDAYGYKVVSRPHRDVVLAP